MLKAPPDSSIVEVALAQRRIARLLELLGSHRTVTTAHPNPQELSNWDLVGPAMLFSAGSVLASLSHLANSPIPGRQQDALILTRRLYEHVVEFAWIAINPVVNAPRWVAEDLHHRVKVDDDAKLLGHPGLDPSKRHAYEVESKKYKRLPKVNQLAEQADQHWSPQIEGHGTFPPSSGSKQWSLRALYLPAYRGGSAFVHPTAMSLRDFVGPGGATNTFTIGLLPEVQDSKVGYVLAPILFSLMLLLAEKVLGWPNADDVRVAVLE